MIMMHPVAVGRAWATVSGTLKIIDGLFETELIGITRAILRKRHQS